MRNRENALLVVALVLAVVAVITQWLHPWIWEPSFLWYVFRTEAKTSSFWVLLLGLTIIAFGNNRKNNWGWYTLGAALVLLAFLGWV